LPAGERPSLRSAVPRDNDRDGCSQERLTAEPMTTLTLDVPRDVFARLKQWAAGAGTSVEAVARELLVEQVARQSMEPREDRGVVGGILRAAGLLAELTPAEMRRGAEADFPLDEISTALDRAGGPPPPELVMGERGPQA
jgi:hypothetical protein